jgi:hypothetical protein
LTEYQNAQWCKETLLEGEQSGGKEVMDCVLTFLSILDATFNLPSIVAENNKLFLNRNCQLLTVVGII